MKITVTYELTKAKLFLDADSDIDTDDDDEVFEAAKEALEDIILGDPEEFINDLKQEGCDVDATLDSFEIEDEGEIDFN